MEFKYHDGQNQRTPLPTPRPLSTITYMNSDIFGRSLQGSKFVPSSFLGNVPVPTIFQTTVPINVEEAFQRELAKKQIQWELQKEEIRREIIADEIALGQWRRLEEEVKREMAAERPAKIPIQRLEEFSIREQASVNSVILNHRMNSRMNNPVNNINIFGGPQSSLPRQVDIRQPYMQTDTNKDKVIISAKPNAGHYGAKRKALTPLAIDDNESSAKKPKKQWSCGLCQITTTSEKGLNDHLQGKKHKGKEASLRTPKANKGTKAPLLLNKSKKCVRFNEVVTVISWLD